MEILSLTSYISAWIGLYSHLLHQPSTPPPLFAHVRPDPAQQQLEHVAPIPWMGWEGEPTRM